jgi:hypothetical protein
VTARARPKSCARKSREKPRIGQDTRGLPRPSLHHRRGLLSWVGRNWISRPFVSRFRVKQRPKPATLRSLAILHHDIESAGRENSTVRRKIDLPMRGKWRPMQGVNTCGRLATSSQCGSWVRKAIHMASTSARKTASPLSHLLMHPEPSRGSGNPSGVGSAERNFGSSLRRTGFPVRAL